MSNPTPESDWLEKQLPGAMAWGHAPVKLSMKDAPPNVKATSIRLERIDGKDPPTVTHAATTAVVNKRDEGSALVIPKAPDGPMMVGTYRISWVIVYSDGSKPTRGSKVYKGMEEYGTDKAYEKEALERLKEDDAKAQTAERKKGRY